MLENMTDDKTISQIVPDSNEASVLEYKFKVKNMMYFPFDLVV